MRANQLAVANLIHVPYEVDWSAVDGVAQYPEVLHQCLRGDMHSLGLPGKLEFFGHSEGRVEGLGNSR
jgi:hypothetical protein